MKPHCHSATTWIPVTPGNASFAPRRCGSVLPRWEGGAGVAPAPHGHSLRGRCRGHAASALSRLWAGAAAAGALVISDAQHSH